MFIELGISLEADIDKAQKIIQEEAVKHPYGIDNRTEAIVDERSEAVGTDLGWSVAIPDHRDQVP